MLELKQGLSLQMLFLQFLTIKALGKVIAEDILIFYCYSFSEKIRLGISCESSAYQIVHIKCQVLYIILWNKKKNQNVVCCSCDLY